MTPLEKTLLIAALALLAWGAALFVGWELVEPVRGAIWWVFGHGGPPA